MTRYHDVIRRLDVQQLGTIARDYPDACWMTSLHVNAMTIPTSMKPEDSAHPAGQPDRDK